MKAPGITSHFDWIDMDSNEKKALADRLRTEGATKQQVADLYGVTLVTLNKWLDPHLEVVGKKDKARMYSPAQVVRIIEIIGSPY